MDVRVPQDLDSCKIAQIDVFDKNLPTHFSNLDQACQKFCCENELLNQSAFSYFGQNAFNMLHQILRFMMTSPNLSLRALGNLFKYFSNFAP